MRSWERRRPDALIADSGARVTAAQTYAMPVQRFPASAGRGPALTCSDLGRLHSSATGVAAPDLDAFNVADAICPIAHLEPAAGAAAGTILSPL
jgi:hypothetical protein